MIVDADADLDAAADAAVWGGMTNAGQTCVGIERVYVAAPVYDEFVRQAGRARPSKIRVGPEQGADIGPITMPEPDRHHPPPHRRRHRPRRAGGAWRPRRGPAAVRAPDHPGRRARGRRGRTRGDVRAHADRQAGGEHADEAVDARQRGLVRVGRRRLRQGARAGDRPAHAHRHGVDQWHAVLRRPAGVAVRRRRRLGLRPHPRRRRSARVRPFEGDRQAPDALAAAVHDLRARAASTSS